MSPTTERTSMDDKERTVADEPVQSYDRRRGPRRAGANPLAGDDRRRYERRKTPGVTALLDDVLNTHVDIDATAAGGDGQTT
jgi:hypothetical protein